MAVLLWLLSLCVTRCCPLGEAAKSAHHHTPSHILHLGTFSDNEWDEFRTAFGEEERDSFLA